jgi:voltage-gated potassium channel
MGQTRKAAAHPSFSIRRKLLLIVFEHHPHHPASRLFNAIIKIAILVSIASLILEHMLPLGETEQRFLHRLDQLTLIIFVSEYVLRAFCGGLQAPYRGKSFATLRYLLSPMALLDLAVILPFFIRLDSVVDLRVLRIVRLAKITRNLRPIWLEFRKLNKRRSFRQQLYSALNPDRYSDRLNEVIDFAMGKLIFLSVSAVMLETVDSIHAPLEAQFHYFDLFTICIFTLEYCARIYVCPEDKAYSAGITGRLRFMMTPIMLIDALSIMPFFLSFFIIMDLRFLRVIRLLRLLKFTRYSTAMTTLIEVLGEQAPALSAAFFTTIIVTIFSASLIYLVEHEAQPEKFSSIPEATYWAIITLLSVGYGDITPITSLGKFMTMLISLMGLGLVALPAGILASGFSQKMQERSERFKALVDSKVRDGVLSEDDRLDLKLKAAAMGLGHYREEELERAEIAAFKRLEQEFRQLSRETQAQPLQTQTSLAEPSQAIPSQAKPSPPKLSPVIASGQVFSFADFDSLLTYIERLSRVEKLEILAHLALELRGHSPERQEGD